MSDSMPPVEISDEEMKRHAGSHWGPKLQMLALEDATYSKVDGVWYLLDVGRHGRPEPSPRLTLESEMLDDERQEHDRAVFEESIGKGLYPCS